jgi:hypothetical protein
MTRSHGWRWSNTLYIYKEDLLWVWTGWGVSIISTNRDSKCESMQNITLRSMRAYNKAGAKPLWPVATVEGGQTLYIYIKKTCYEYELDGGVLIISTNWESTFCTHDIHSQVIESKYQGVAASIWPIASVAVAELHYICIKKICYEYEGDVGS